MPGWTKRDLERQYRRALASGWIPLIRSAAEIHGFRTEDLLGVGSRESELNPYYQSHPGDHGNGFSMWQIDIGSYPEWIKTGAWRDVEKAVMKAAEVLATKRNEVRALARAHGYKFDSPAAEMRTVLAAYNHGAKGSTTDMIKFGSPDRNTTGHDYGYDTLRRIAVFKSLLYEEPSRPTTGQSTSTLQTVPSTATTPESDQPDLFSRLSTNDDVRTAGRSAGLKLINRLGTPFSTLLLALEAGNIYAWLGVAVIIIGLGVFIYFERRTIARTWQKAKAKLAKL